MAGNDCRSRARLARIKARVAGICFSRPAITRLSGVDPQRLLCDPIGEFSNPLRVPHDSIGGGDCSGRLRLHSRVRLCVHEAKRKIRIFAVSCRSAMNFVRESLFAGAMRNSGSVWRNAFATTNSEGGTPGRMVRSQDPNESQTRLGSNDRCQ
jgi:hypothetical protein